MKTSELRLVTVFGLLCLGQTPYKGSGRLVLPTVATFSQTSGCIYVQKGRDEDGRVVEEDVQICDVFFMAVFP